MESFSVAIIAADRSVILPQCLDTARKISDDIVIVTNTDHKFVDFAHQKNYAISQTKYNWVLSLDADESLPPELITEISNLDFSKDAYSMPRLNYIFGKPIYHADWSPENDRHVWLFDKTKCHWEGTVHEHVAVTGSVGHLKNPKIHLNYQSVEQFIQKLNLYTSFEAKNKTYNPTLLFIYPFWKFIRHFIVFQGYLDGQHGFFLSYLQAIYGLTVYVKSWTYRNLAKSA